MQFILHFIATTLFSREGAKLGEMSSFYPVIYHQ
jgi:hypothetical protein